MSREVSQEITTFKDAIGAALADVADVGADPLWRRIVADHCPPSLVTGHFQKLLATAPADYLCAVVAAEAASSIVYREGLGWLRRVAGLRNVLDVVRTYYREMDAVAAQVAAVRRSRLPGRERIGRVLARTGSKLLCEEALGLDTSPEGGKMP